MLNGRNWVPVACAGAMLTLARAADFVTPDVKLGLWEVRMIPNVSGSIPIPDEQLAGLSPEQRARLEAAMQNGLASAAKPRLYKECMTKDKLSQGFATEQPSAPTSCQKKVISSSAHELHIHTDCTQSEGKATVDVRFEISGGTQMTGKIDAVMTSGTRSMQMHSELQGKWLSASCGTVKDVELEK